MLLKILITAALDDNFGNLDVLLKILVYDHDIFKHIAITK